MCFICFGGEFYKLKRPIFSALTALRLTSSGCASLDITSRGFTWLTLFNYPQRKGIEIACNM